MMWFLGLDIGFDQGFWVFGRFYTVRAARIPLYLLSGNPKPIIMGLCYFGGMKTTVEIRDPLMAEAKEVCALHNITLKGLIERALAAEIEKLAAQQRWQPTDEFLWHGPVDPNIDVIESIDQMYLTIMAEHENLGK